jgi:HAD superfamily 5'-nucleotidase-like hydrolase
MQTLDDLAVPPPRERGVFCNRTLNMRSIRAIGYDMDYTLIHYRVGEWERRAYEHIRQRLKAQGWPTDELSFDPDLVMRGLIIDAELGNVVKANRFGYVKRAYHGTQPLDFEATRRTYARTVIDLSQPRWIFINTFFSLSEACIYAQLVDLLDERRIPAVLGYADLYERVRTSVDDAHMEGALKAEIMADPDRFVDLDADTPLALLDQKAAGKKIMLITNSEWYYTNAMMTYAFDRFMPKGMTWRDLFHVVIVAARKPEFFSSRSPMFEVVSEDGLLRPWIGALKEGGRYFGGNAALLEKSLGMSGDEILYVGDHIYGDVHVSKSLLRWRTALIVRELEDEVLANEAARPDEARLSGLMVEKERLELFHCHLKLELQRARGDYGPVVGAPVEEVQQRMVEVRAKLSALDEQIAPLAKAAGEVRNARWGQLMRAGNDKSHLARQIERRADIYTSRVSNFLFLTPFVFLRSMRGSLPHDPAAAAAVAAENLAAPAPGEAEG